MAFKIKLVGRCSSGDKSAARARLPRWKTMTRCCAEGILIGEYVFAFCLGWFKPSKQAVAEESLLAAGGPLLFLLPAAPSQFLSVYYIKASIMEDNKA